MERILVQAIRQMERESPVSDELCKLYTREENPFGQQLLPSNRPENENQTGQRCVWQNENK